MVVRKVANPAPAMLALVNPKRRKKTMATKKRKSSKRRTVRHTAPRKAARKTTRRHNPKTRHAKRRVYASRRHHSTTHHRRRSRRRGFRLGNPLGAAGGEILNFTVAGLAQGIAQPLVGGFASRFLPFGQYNAPIITAGTGWLLSKAFGMFSLTRRFSHAALVFGVAAAAMQVLQPIVSRTVAGAGMSGWNGQGRRVRGIAAVTGIPPTITPPPLPPAAQSNANGMNGMAPRPGAWAY